VGDSKQTVGFPLQLSPFEVLVGVTKGFLRIIQADNFENKSNPDAFWEARTAECTGNCNSTPKPYLLSANHNKWLQENDKRRKQYNPEKADQPKKLEQLESVPYTILEPGIRVHQKGSYTVPLAWENGEDPVFIDFLDIPQLRQIWVRCSHTESW
jgi:hypothetical protein